jgi:hypothetical protein
MIEQCLFNLDVALLSVTAETVVAILLSLKAKPMLLKLGPVILSLGDQVTLLWLIVSEVAIEGLHDICHDDRGLLRSLLRELVKPSLHAL